MQQYKMEHETSSIAGHGKFLLQGCNFHFPFLELLCIFLSRNRSSKLYNLISFLCRIINFTSPILNSGPIFIFPPNNEGSLLNKWPFIWGPHPSALVKKLPEALVFISFIYQILKQWSLIPFSIRDKDFFSLCPEQVLAVLLPSTFIWLHRQTGCVALRNLFHWASVFFSAHKQSI